MIDSKRSYKTNLGDKVKIVTTTKGPKKYPVIGIIGDDVLCWTQDGRFDLDARVTNEMDLVEDTTWETLVDELWSAIPDKFDKSDIVAYLESNFESVKRK